MVQTAARRGEPEVEVQDVAHGRVELGSALRRNLRALGRIYDELARQLTVSSPVGERRRGSRNPGIPLNGRAVEVRGDILTILSSWAGFVVNELGRAVPERTVPALTAFLTQHSRWLVGHPAGQDAVEETRQLLLAGKRALQSTATKRIPVCPCTNARCEGTLIAMISAPESDQESIIVCTENREHSWSTERWYNIGGTIPAPARAAAGALGVDYIAAAWNLAPGTVYWLANTYGWRRHRQGRKTLYNREDVVRTMAERATRASEPTNRMTEAR
jgi:hypothetical protein